MEAKSNSKRISAVIKDNKHSQKTRWKSHSDPRDRNALQQSRAAKLTSSRNSHGGEPVNSEPEWSPDDIFSQRRIERSLLEFDGLSASGPDGIRHIMLQKGLLPKAGVL